MAHIDYYFATISPFTYLSSGTVEEIVAKHGATITYKPLDIMGLFARTGGVPPKDRHPSRQAYRLEDMARRAKRLGRPLNPQPAFWPTNPAPSSYALIAAQKAGGGDLGKLMSELTSAVWAGEKNIAEDDVIRAALSAAGFDPALADSGMLEGAEEYARNLEDAVANNVFGAPFFVVDGTTHFWGQDRLEDLDLHLAGEL
ncbi:2-hydroxychromene-2-carboxylate isomerase [Roseobacter sp. HKCCD9010]|uniref:2-hydroxychromene-2-carboxylate isomerase n=1 Tax=unclassified Roseobacter TaxID=196798 RepID=UPI0014926EE2|nr:MULTISPECIES: 2-hydroxychromene-2-carboxylate isomerase [unclassified Roseobacter]MBF9051223.1 2-hydroxychromene-2-carboxylate isomerase [Rhodobacterales bacterium HKCCD4356]NNV13270.1 2-hydroxychromene-2-carboxylate isomerase [Roseobacter sp. HKCCD7357]NNV17521.1 2-hydroxychromene-2-carboxylate isomerase [Roseobacter sp. HKCCD8768]NNV27127.1 2-hydroxychromene-2-carboxylate isomerase [Roseobacter sp. HKCCD8192]NNV31247.1 2-hydroxychromene-2-carboxylate isomerase [Roseobacter sp. HKCCD9061]